ncbi:MAG: hypothetical protein R3F17_07150 [Planctomycetota bacterium]
MEYLIFFCSWMMLGMGANAGLQARGPHIRPEEVVAANIDWGIPGPTDWVGIEPDLLAKEWWILPRDVCSGPGPCGTRSSP